MKGMIRTVLVDPNPETRQGLQTLLGGISTLWVAEVAGSYQTALAQVAQHVPDLTIVSLDADIEAGINLIQALVRDHPNAVVLPAGAQCDSSTVVRAMRSGAREFLLLPTTADDLLDAVYRLVQERATPVGEETGKSRVIAITGASGGVGCTSLAVNLSATLAKDPEHEVALVDADLLTGAADACLDIIPERSLIDVTRDVTRLDHSLLKRSLIKHASGLYVLPRPPVLEEAARLEPEAIARVFQMLRETFPLLVLDLSKALQSSDFAAMEMADTILLVVRLEPDCLRNTARLLDLMRQFEGMIDKVKIVANSVGYSECEIGVKKAQEVLRVPVAWQIPYSPKIFDPARSKGLPVEAEASGSRAHRAIIDIALGFAFSPVIAGRNKHLLGRIAASFF